MSSEPSGSSASRLGTAKEVLGTKVLGFIDLDFRSPRISSSIRDFLGFPIIPIRILS